MSAEHEHPKGEGGPVRAKWVLIGFLAVAGFFLFTEHQAHVLGALPYILLLACPLLHFFMHGGHGHGGHDHRGTDDSREKKQ